MKDYPIFFATQRKPAKDSSGEKLYLTRPIVRYFEPSGDDMELVTYQRAVFLAKYGSIEEATVYLVSFPDKTSRKMTLAQIETKYGSIEALEEMKGHATANLKMPIESREYVRDSHGHLVVEHDLYEHEGLLGPGIAEAFAEFAKKERLSFF